MFIQLFPFTESRLLLFEQLFEMDKEWTVLSYSLCSAILKASKLGIYQGNGSFYDAFITGSNSEGGAIARLFKPTDGHISRDTEIDTELVLLDIPVSHKNLVEDISDKEGFVKVRFTDDILYDLILKGNWKVKKEDYTKYVPFLFEDGYVRPDFLKEKIRRALIWSDRSRNMLEDLLSGSIEKDVNLIIRPPKLTKATVESSIGIYIDKNYIINWAWDVSTVFRIHWWPDIAREWVFRKRNWPKKSFINEITKTAYIITKSSVEPSLEKDVTELRYSFSHLERALVSRRSADQNYIYFIFKSMFYKWIKPIDSDIISSFFAKTVMFWACEEFSPDNRMWQKCSCVHAINHLFRELLSALEKSHLPYYFIPSINVIENISDYVRIKMISIVKEIVCDTEKFVPENVGEVIGVSQEMLSMAKSVNKVIMYYNYKLFRALYSVYVNKNQPSQMFFTFATAAVQEVLFWFALFFIELNRLYLIPRRR